MTLKGKVALVTGASSGIGRSFAYLLAAQGMNLALVARTQEKLEAIAKDLQEKHQIQVKLYPMDLSTPAAGKTLYDQVKSDGVAVDLLINNAGYGKWGKFEAFSIETYHSMVQLNVTCLMDLCYLFMKDFLAKPEAGIINVGSTASFIPVPYSSVYAATKSFVLSFTEGLVGELRDTNVVVSCLCPGGTESNFAAVANSNNHEVNSTTEMKSPDEVARLGLEAFQKGKHYVVTGRQMQLKIMKFLSRKRVINMIADYWKKILGL